jgi:arsenate reductase (glutaredoxin)
VTTGSRIYFNPSCSKCRTALSMLTERGLRADVVRYLDEPPTETDRLMGLLGIDDPRLMMRTGEPVYAELGLADHEADADALLGAIAAHPILLERPIFVVGDRAVIARPPERLLELL